MNSNDDFVFFGTALEELDPDEIPRKKYQPDLTVRDAQGRRRFHGAFTGGFSAGFYNTVGTKEGWAPASFTSSKANRAQGITMRPEDYMDEEDVGEFGIAPKKIQVNKDFADFSEKRKRMREPTRGHDEPIPGSPPLKNLFRPSSETIGLKLLSKMGWKPGQGIGPRLTKKDKKHKEKQSHKVYGCSLPLGLGGELSSSSEDDEYAEGFTFAPSDAADASYETKTNQHGIGYVSLDAHSVLTAPVDLDRPTTAKAHLEKGRRKLAISGQAFGVGAFEDEDTDIYAREDMSQYSFFLSEELSSSTTGETALSKRGGHQSGVHQMMKVLEGFHIAKEAPSQRKVYPPPKIPPDFEPIHCSAKREKRRFGELKADLCKEEKTEHIGSVFDLLSPEDRARLESVKRGQDSVCKKGSTSAERSESNADREMESASISRTLPSVSQARPASLEPVGRPAEINRPFAKNEAKQKRFEQYLALLNSNRAELYAAMQPMMMTEWEKEKERKEFEQAAMICQPSKSLGLRFVSKNMLADDDAAVDVLFERVEENDDKAKAAELGMFGKLTHEEFEWHPADLLCKRYNVPNPYPGCETVGVGTVKIDKRSVFSFLNDPDGEVQESKASEAISLDAGDDNKTNNPSTSLAELLSRNAEEPTPDTKSEDDNIGEAREDKRPPRSLFKAIFSEESSSDEEGSSADAKVLVPTGSAVQGHAPEPTGIGAAAEKKPASKFELHQKTLTRPARGVFANLDFDRLNALPPEMPVEELQRMTQPVTSNTQCQAKTEKVEKAQENKSDIYGPCLPPPGMVLQHTQSSANAGHKHKKKGHNRSGKKKHKKQKSKPKRKKKKHNKKASVKSRPAHCSSSSDSEDSSEGSSEAERDPSCIDAISMLKQVQKFV